MTEGLTNDRDAFFDQFTTQFFSVDSVLQVTQEQRQQALALAHQSDQKAALGCLEAFGTTDFRDDLTKVSVPTLVVHGDGDATVPFEGSAPARTPPSRTRRFRSCTAPRTGSTSATATPSTRSSPRS